MDLSSGEMFAHDTGTLLHARWRCLMTQGIMLTILGALAVALPVVTTFAIDVVIGWLLLFGGVWRTIAHLRANHSPGFGWYLTLAVLAIVLGAAMLIVPVAGVRTLTGLLLFAFFMLEGVGKIVFALDLRTHAQEWVWALTTGFLDLSLAVLIVAGWPSTAAWAIGLLVGINMMAFGVALVAISIAARHGRRLGVKTITGPDAYVSAKKSSPAR